MAVSVAGGVGVGVCTISLPHPDSETSNIRRETAQNITIFLTGASTVRPIFSHPFRISLVPLLTTVLETKIFLSVVPAAVSRFVKNCIILPGKQAVMSSVCRALL